ncbi:MAG: heavy metal translocating P-type ATPase [Desulfuromonas thiophila]|jgi:Cu2+-exporting ATPase|nr:heavy metal translocating P-type ATPase [Desulfuromonas thiophila]
MAAPEIVHELPRRLRLRWPPLRDRRSDALYVQALLENIPGVTQVRVNRAAATLVLQHDGAPATRAAILARFDPLPGEAFRCFEPPQPAINPLNLAFLGVSIASLRLLPPTLQGTISLLIGLPTLLAGADGLLNRGVKVEVLDAGAVGISLLRRDYFTANMIVLLLNVGEYLRQSSEDQTTGLLRTLLRPQVEQVWLEREGIEVQTPLAQVRTGDLLLCGPGELVPLDGTICRGDALLNQSSITGEALPVHRQAGDSVPSGALVTEGRIVIRVEAVGSDTGLARINRFLEQSLRQRSRTQQRSDELADRLVPVTLALGGGIFLLTGDLRRAAAALTVDYSCAIKLATPIAVKTAMYRAAQQGVLIKGAQAFDQLARVDTLVFDKTGTLTQGELFITDIVPLNHLDENGLLALTAAAEEHYAHPVAKAVLRAARDRALTLPATSQVDFIVAHGVSAHVDGQQVLVGSHHFVAEDEGIDCGAAAEPAAAFARQGKNLLYVSRAGRLEGLIALRDRIRPEAAGILTHLKQNGIRRIVVLTGDQESTARALLQALPQIDALHWELQPEDKAGIVQQLRDRGHYTAFIGDGVNDAPALVTADVGISLPCGADLAKDAAQALLLQEDLTCLATALDAARRTGKTIQDSFYATIGFNSLFLLLALTGRIRPLTAALLHNLNTVGILGYCATRGLSASDPAARPAAPKDNPHDH